ncbi:BAG family molecular chaperone regulator 4-like [Andrographis paniculata]|uniref:BAG family molecular chaperone regulator 4-like n=1 Tax=Andrographis paniculata TaxID=175694 RepID=UPI0021E75641|nr:BAG family molecular chaperone regulator 4-like [Andrographis paniculata]
MSSPSFGTHIHIYRYIDITDQSYYIHTHTHTHIHPFIRDDQIKGFHIMIRLRPKRFSRSSSKGGGGGGGGGTATATTAGEIKWELRPGGMLVQKRDHRKNDQKGEEEVIKIRVSTVSHHHCRHHDITIHPTCTFGEVKMVLSLVTNVEAKEQRVLYRGKEREDDEHLHMVGVKDKDKLLMLEMDPHRNPNPDPNPNLHPMTHFALRYHSLPN